MAQDQLLHIEAKVTPPMYQTSSDLASKGPYFVLGVGLWHIMICAVILNGRRTECDQEEELMRDP